MFAIDSMKHKEIARFLNISENTSKTQYRKARLMLQEQVQQIRKQRYEA
jgi:DNA-directed RNA polymerase specialized sigma24 family protein